MKEKEQGAASTATPDNKPDAKLTNSKDIAKVLNFFSLTTGTTLDCMFGTGVLRNSITWYVVDLIDEGLLQVVFKRADSHTGRIAQYYSADAKQWTKSRCKEGELWA